MAKPWRETPEHIVRNSLVLLLMALLLACASVPGTAASPAYAPERLHLHQIGHLIVQAEINQKQVYLVVDTAAGKSVIDANEAVSLGVKVADEKLDGAIGAGGAGLKIELSRGNRFRIAGTDSDDFTFYVMDLNHVVNSLSTPERRISGVVGADWLDRHGAVISYSARTITATR